MEKEYEKSQMTFARNKNGEGNMDIDMDFKGEGTEEETLMSLLDGVMEGLSATILNELNVKKVENINLETLKLGWEVIENSLHVYSVAYARLKNSILEDLGEEEEKPDELDLLLALASVPTLNHAGVRLFTHEETTFSFENEIGFGYHALDVKGSVNSVRESLVYMVFFLLVYGFRLEEGIGFPIDKLISIEMKRMKEHSENEKDFNKYVNPWLIELNKLDKA